MADIDQILARHVRGERFEVKHSCPECPMPDTVTSTGLVLNPSPSCVVCGGTGLATTEDLARWQKRRIIEMPN